MNEEHKHGHGETITIKRETLWKAGTFIFAALFVLSLIVNGGLDLSNLGSNTNNNVGNVAAPTAQPTAGNIQVKIDNTDPVLGDKNAEITIVEFSDFQCPFCQRVADDAIAQFKQSDYFKNGDVNLVYKHFPLTSIHPHAQKAAEASECARRQNNDKFWQYHDVLFANQGALDVASLKSYASQVGLNTAQFNKCLDNNEAASKVSNDLKQSSDAGAQGTPYFVLINKDGKTTSISGAQPWVNFEAAIKSL